MLYDVALSTPSLDEQLRGIAVGAAAPDRRSSAYLRAFAANEIKLWEAIIKDSGITLN